MDSGQVIRVRPSPGNLTSKLKNLKTSEQILFSSSDSDDKSIWGVTTVFVPKWINVTMPATVSFQMTSLSANIDESPSYLLASKQADVRWDVLDRMLGLGWHVLVPDHGGPLASYSAGKKAGQLVLDSMQAFFDLAGGRYGLKANSVKFAAWGYSDGAAATAWAFIRKTKHAPWLQGRLRTYAMGGLPVNPLRMLLALDQTEDTVKVITGLSGLMTDYPEYNGTMQRLVHAEGAFNISAFDRIKTLKLEDAYTEYANQNLSEYFVGGLAQAVKDLDKMPENTNIFRKVKQNSDVGEDVVQLQEGIMVYHAINDQLAAIADVDRLVKKFWCIKRQYVYYRRNREGGHCENGHASLDAVLEFISLDFHRHYWWYVIGRPSSLCDIIDVSATPSMEDMTEYLD